MSISRLLSEKTIELDLESKDKAGVIAELVDVLVQADRVRDRNTVLQAVLDREKMMSTGIGKGVAIPHARTPATDGVLLAFGRCPRGIKFEAVDARLVDLVFLLISPKISPTESVRTLGKIARLMDDERIREALRKAATPQEVIEIIRRGEGRLNQDREGGWECRYLPGS